MPRPSLKSERQERILDAAERCIARSGLAGATLDQIAAEAGLARSLLRHNVGNREQILDATTQRFLTRTRDQMDQLIADLPERDGGATLVDWLFDPSATDPHTVLVSEALIAAAPADPALAKTLRDWTEYFIDTVADFVGRDHPDAAADDVYAVAAGIIGISFNVDSLVPLGGLSKVRRASHKAAKRLLGTLS